MKNPQNTENENRNEKKSNVGFIYTYTESILKQKSESLNRLDLKFYWIIAASGVVLKLASDIDTSTCNLESLHLVCYSCKILKIILCILPAISTIVSVMGLTPNATGNYPDPAALIKKDLYELSEEDLKCRILGTLIGNEKFKGIGEEYDDLALKKSKKLKLSIALIQNTIVLFGVTTALMTLLT